MLYKFFYPRFINIQVGDTVEWINKDKHHHVLVFNKEIPPYEMKIGNGYGPSIFSIIEPSLFIIKNDGVAWNPEEFAEAMSLSMNESYFLSLKHELNSSVLIPFN